MASESALTAMDTVLGWPASTMPRSASTSPVSSASWRAYLATTSPDSVSRTGLDRISSTRPIRCSSSLIRWLTADGVRCSARAAASKVPWSTAATRVRTSSVGSSGITASSRTLMILKNL